MLGEDELGTCKQLLAGVSVGIAEWSVLFAPFPSLPDFLILQVTSHPAVCDAHIVQGIVVEFLDVEAVIGDACLWEYRTDNEHHRWRQVERDLLHLTPSGTVKQLQYADDIFRLSPPDHSHQRTRSAMAVLVGQERVQFTIGQACLVNAKMEAQILREQQILLGMEPLVPLAEVAEMLLVLSDQLLTVYTIVIGYALDAFRCGLNPILLKKLQTQG